MVAYAARLTPPIECIRLHDDEAELDGFVAIHSTALGPGAGGCRLWTYDGLNEMLTDALQLAEGMSYKNAMAGLPFGGAKAVLRRPPGDFDRGRLFRAFGRAVEALDGRYITAEDVGTSIEDMQQAASATRHVAGLASTGDRAGGDPSPWTALGVFESMRAAAGFVFGSDLAGLTVAVQGIGNVGSDLCRRLGEAGARLVIADPCPERLHRVAGDLGARVAGVGEIASVNADIFAPCALGGALTPEVVRNMKARLVCGAANNQLASPAVADQMKNRNIAYAPDYVVNAGGIISVTAEYLGEMRTDVECRVSQIAPRVTALLDRAAREGRSPSMVADEMAEKLITDTQKAVA